VYKDLQRIGSKRDIRHLYRSLVIFKEKKIERWRSKAYIKLFGIQAYPS